MSNFEVGAARWTHRVRHGQHRVTRRGPVGGRRAGHESQQNRPPGHTWEAKEWGAEGGEKHRSRREGKDDDWTHV